VVVAREVAAAVASVWDPNFVVVYPTTLQTGKTNENRQLRVEIRHRALQFFPVMLNN